MIKKIILDFVSSTVILIRFLWNLNFLDIFSKHAQVSNLMKIRSVGAELIHRDEWMDRLDELVVAARSFADAPQNCSVVPDV
jgi:hypothetical protein